MNPVPVIVTSVPPTEGPEFGEMFVTEGAATYVYSSDDEVFDVPPGVVIVTSTVPGEPAGTVAVIDVALSTLNDAALEPNDTSDAPVKPVPETTMVEPPVAAPCDGETDVTVGTGAYVNWSASDVTDVPATVVTVTSTVPVPAGDTAVIFRSVSITVKLGTAGFVPKLTAVVGVKSDPGMMTVVPPPSA